MPAAAPSLRARAGLRVLDGFGHAVRAACRYAAPRDEAELAALLAAAREEGLPVAFRGAGRSYGDAALNQAGLVVDLRAMDRVLSWDPEAGIADAQSGLTIEGLWRRALPDGFWPAVVPGTMLPTLGGCVSMNVHGKNNFRAGPFGDHVLDFDLLTPGGEKLRCSRDENREVFFAALGGMGLLGAVTRVRMQLKRVESGFLEVEPACAPTLDAMFDAFEARLPRADYLVGWLDCFASGSALGRGVIHQANYLSAAKDPLGRRSLEIERQGLPPRILGIPRRLIWKLMRPFMNDAGMRLVNAAKYAAARLDKPGQPYLQSHVAFAFLLDYVPNWRLAYGREGFIQVQIFVPAAAARQTMREVLRLCQERGLPSYLGVLKRHRPDEYLLSHALDGYSLAMDMRVTRANRAALWSLSEAITLRVLDAGGKFYFAKDAVLRPQDVERAYGRERIDAFFALKERLDPTHLLTSDLARRALTRSP